MAELYTVKLPDGGEIRVRANSPEDARLNVGAPPGSSVSGPGGSRGSGGGGGGSSRPSAPPPRSSSGGGGGGGGGSPAAPPPSGTVTYITAGGQRKTLAQLRQELLAAGADPNELRNADATVAVYQRTALPQDRIVSIPIATATGISHVPTSPSLSELPGAPPPAAAREGGVRAPVDVVGPGEERGPSGAGGTAPDQPGAVPPADQVPPTTPQPPAGPTRPVTNPVTGEVYQVSEADYNAVQQDLERMAQEIREAQQFSQGVEQQKLDLQAALNAAQIAYQQALVEGRNRELALQEARDAMEAEFRRQEIELRRFLAAAQVSAERERLDIERRRLRPQRLAQVRFV